jgi:hypothetical protein
MLFAYTSVFVLLMLLVSCAVIGHALVQLLPLRWQPFGRLYFSPVLGVSVLLLLATLLAWTSGHFSSWFVRLLAIAIVLISFLFLRDRSRFPHYLGFLFLFAAIASFPMLVQVWRFGAFSTAIDQYTYLSHAQWLQAHTFRDSPDVDFHPLWSQVTLYQHLQLRMGSSFFLGWIQGLFGAQWSYQVYPAFMALAVVAAGLAAAGGIAVITGANRKIALLLGLCLPLTLNGFAFGAVSGFVPQSYGLLSALAGLILLGLILERCRRNEASGLIGLAVSTSIALAASIHAYAELTPFIGAAAGAACVSAFLVHRHGRRLLFIATAVVAAFTVLLVNLQWLRAYKSIVESAGAVAGWAVQWSPLEFWTHTVGWRAGSGDGFGGLASYYPFNAAMGIIVLVVLIGGIIFVLPRTRTKWVAAPHLALLFLLGLGFLYFRYRAKSPWPEGYGQSWNQYKLSQWSSPAVFLCLGTTLAWVSLRSRGARWAVAVAALFVIGLGLHRNYVKADERTYNLRQAAASNTEPFLAYESLRNSVTRNANPNDIIYVDLLGQEQKSRQMMTYFLFDRSLVSDWRDDGYISGWITPGRQRYPVSGANWIISSNMKPSPKAVRLLPWYFFRVTPSSAGLQLRAVDDAYDKERDGGTWWHWTKKQITFTFDVSPVDKARPELKVRTQYTPAKWNTTVTCTIKGNGVDRTETILMTNPGTYESQPFKVDPGTLVVRFSTDTEPSRFSHDPRPLAFLIRDLDVVPASDVPAPAE